MKTKNYPTDTAKRRTANPAARSKLHKFNTEEIQGAWGLACSFDVYNCDPATIRDADRIKQFVIKLCELIEMKRFQDTLVVDFGEDERVAGYSMVQLIETSLISAHFANQTNTTYLDVFSCKPYDPDVVEEFSKEFFGGTHCITHMNVRR